MHALELFGVVYLRFHPVLRLWCVWLVGVNDAYLLFIAHVEAQVVLAVTAIAVAGQNAQLSTHWFHQCPEHESCINVSDLWCGALMLPRHFVLAGVDRFGTVAW